MIIVGGGPAGYSAALYAARAGLDTLVIEKMTVGGQMALTGDIDNYPGFDEGIDGFTLGMKMQAAASRFGALTEYGEVRSLELSDKIKRVLTDGGEYLSRTLVIATGAYPKELPALADKRLIGRGVHYCAHCDGRFYKGKAVVVVGGGNSAVEDALYRSRLAARVYLVHRRDSFRASKVYLEALMRTDNIELVLNSEVSGYKLEERLLVITVRCGEGMREISCDGVFVSIGRRPATELVLGKLELDGGGYIIADETTRTSIPGVFAIGDVRTKALRQVVTAAADGAVCVHFAEEYLAECD